jgi:hypothetical protein
MNSWRVLFVLFSCAATLDDDALIERSRHVRRLDVAGPLALARFASDATVRQASVAQQAGAAHVVVWKAAPLVVLLEGEGAEQESHRVAPQCEASEVRDWLRAAIGEIFVALAAPPTLLEPRSTAAHYTVGFTVDTECNPQIVAVVDFAGDALHVSGPLKLALTTLDASSHALLTDEDTACRIVDALREVPEDIVAFPSAAAALLAMAVLRHSATDLAFVRASTDPSVTQGCLVLQHAARSVRISAPADGAEIGSLPLEIAFELSLSDTNAHSPACVARAWIDDRTPLPVRTAGHSAAWVATVADASEGAHHIRLALDCTVHVATLRVPELRFDAHATHSFRFVRPARAVQLVVASPIGNETYPLCRVPILIYAAGDLRPTDSIRLEAAVPDGTWAAVGEGRPVAHRFELTPAHCWPSGDATLRATAVCAHACTNTHMRACARAHARVHTRVLTQTGAHMHAHAHRHTRARASVHTHARTDGCARVSRGRGGRQIRRRRGSSAAAGDSLSVPVSRA